MSSKGSSCMKKSLVHTFVLFGTLIHDVDFVHVPWSFGTRRGPWAWSERAPWEPTEVVHCVVRVPLSFGRKRHPWVWKERPLHERE